MRIFLFFAMICSTMVTSCASAQDFSQANTNQPQFGQSWADYSAQSSEGELGEAWFGESKQEFESTESDDPWDEPIETDRHDFTQSAKVVGRGVKQLEYGFFYSTLAEGTERETTYATPELLLRYGLSERAEFRTRYNYAFKYNNEGEDIQGSRDIVFGMKYQLSESEGRCPETAVELRLSAPTGSSAISTGRWEPGVDFIYGWEIGERYSLYGSTGGNANALGDTAFIGVDTDPNDHFIAWTQSMALGAQLTNKSTGYFEWFGVFTYGRDDDESPNFLNVGLDYLINQNVVVDFRIGWGLTEASDDLFAGIGGAFRF